MLARGSRFGFLVLCLAVCVACASNKLETSTSFDPLAQFPDEATFSWDDAANRLPSNESLAALDLDPLIREAANAEMAKRGYRMVSSGSADYQLSYELAVNTWIGADNSSSVASLSLLLVDAKRGNKVWLGYGRAEMNVNISRDERLARLRSAAAKMLAKFPPR
jgi:hypothetical protein